MVGEKLSDQTAHDTSGGPSRRVHAGGKTPLTVTATAQYHGDVPSLVCLVPLVHEVSGR